VLEPNFFRFDMTHCGRIYQNPMQRNEIYLNVGWSVADKQVYPQYEDWFAAHGLSETQYDEVVARLQGVFAQNGFSKGTVWCCMRNPCVCCCTCGINICVMKCLANGLDKKLAEAIKAVCKSAEIKLSIRLELVQVSGQHSGSWLDSRGQHLLSMDGQVVGPPMGHNLVIELRNKQQWPPAQHSGTNPPGQQEIVCQACGASSPAESKFCHSCEKAPGDVCKECGAPCPATNKFCPSCGAEVQGFRIVQPG